RPPLPTLSPYTPLFRSLAVRGRLAPADALQLAPDPSLEVRAERGQSKVELPPLAAEVGRELVRGPAQHRVVVAAVSDLPVRGERDRKSTRLNSSHVSIS